MGSTRGFDGVCRKYIIPEIKLQGWVAARDSKTDKERLIYSIPLHGTGYDTNNCAVWHEIQNCCTGNTSYDWIREF